MRLPYTVDHTLADGRISLFDLEASLEVTPRIDTCGDPFVVVEGVWLELSREREGRPRYERAGEVDALHASDDPVLSAIGAYIAECAKQDESLIERAVEAAADAGDLVVVGSGDDERLIPAADGERDDERARRVLELA